MNELLPCPFCADPVQGVKLESMNEFDGYNTIASIPCTGCDMVMSLRSHEDRAGWCIESKDNLVARISAKWNTRKEAAQS